MVENRPWANFFAHTVLIIGVALVVFPVYIAVVASTQAPGELMRGTMPLLPGSHGIENYTQMWQSGISTANSPPAALMLWNSFVMAMAITLGKLSISLLSAFAIVYFRFRFRMFFFWLIFVTLMLPVEVRIIPTFQVVADLNMLNSFAGLSIPLIASATATFLFRQFFMTIPEEMLEAARVDGVTNIAALFVIMFIYGWNQYLWPLLITTDPDYTTIVMGIQRMTSEENPQWHLVMAAVVMAALPPVLVILFMQRLFVKGLTETEK